MSTWTYDTTTLTGALRLLIDDRDLSKTGDDVPLEKRSAIFTDEELAVFLASSADVPLLAASYALRTIAANRSLMVQRRSVGDTTVDYGALRADLLKQAEAYKTQYDELVGGLMAPADGVAEVAWTDSALRHIVVEQGIREANGGL